MIFKILLFGPEGVSKNTLIEKYCEKIFDPNSKLAIGVEFYAKNVISQGYKVTLQIWDLLSENSQLKRLLPSYCLGANAALLIFDITESVTINKLHERIHFIRKQAGDLPLLLVGNNLDSGVFHELIEEKEIEILKELNVMSYTVISTKTGENVEKMFMNLADFLVDKY